MATTKQNSEVPDLIGSFSSYSPDSGIELECSYGSLAGSKRVLMGERTLLGINDNEFLNRELDRRPEMSVDNGTFKYDDPLSEPLVRQSLEKVHISGVQLMNMTVKELNKRLAHCPAFIISKLKRCRRTLKNRGYAKNCRVKRIALKNQLEQVNMSLIRENSELRQYNKSLIRQLNQLMLRNNQPMAYEQPIDNNQHLGSYNPEAVMLNQPPQDQQHQVEYSDCNHSTASSVQSAQPNPEVSRLVTTNQDSYYLPPLNSELDYLAEQLALD